MEKFWPPHFQGVFMHLINHISICLGLHTYHYAFVIFLLHEHLFIFFHTVVFCIQMSQPNWSPEKRLHEVARIWDMSELHTVADAM